MSAKTDQIQSLLRLRNDYLEEYTNICSGSFNLSEQKQKEANQAFSNYDNINQRLVKHYGYSEMVDRSGNGRMRPDIEL